MTPCEAEAIIAAAQEENANLFKALRVAEAENADLRRQLEDARALVVRSGYFQTDDPPLYDDGGPVCLPCRNGDHSQHQPTLADACIGCACEVMR